MTDRGSTCHLDLADSDLHTDRLVSQSQNGNTDAFRTLYLSFAPKLLGYLRSLVGENDADDVASETWARIYIDLSAFRPDRGDFAAWVWSIARHRAIDHFRRARPVILLPTTDLPRRAAPEDTERDAFESLAAADAVALLKRLPRDQAAAVLLRVIIGFDAPTAGRILHKQPSAVRTSAHRGLRTLRDRVKH